ncbi:MAG: citrate transporter [Pyramidobacter sp.]|nr:citrate transporter [Pyramidobacter sp.]
MLFGLSPIWGLLPLLLYIVLAFKKGMHPLVNVAVCVLFGAILTKQPLGSLGAVISKSMGSFLALVGLIIMLGAGLGAVLRKTGVADNIVNILMRRIGVSTQKRAIIATMVCSVVLVTLLGTLAGANAIIAPIVIPLVAAVGICPSTLAVIFQGAGQTGLFLSPFSPPMVTLMGISGLSYPQILLCAGLPISIIMWIGVYFTALSIQKHADGSEKFEGSAEAPADYTPTPAASRATATFLITMALLVAYGIYAKGGASYVIIVMLTAAIVTGVAGGLSLGAIFDAIMEGCGKMFWLYFMFLLFNPFLDFVVKSGAFGALVDLLKPYLQSTGKLGFSLLTGAIGVFGINGAAVAQAMMMNEMFAGFLQPLGISMQLWVLIVLVGHQITSFAYPGLDMLAQMGLAHAKDVKPMLKLAYFAIIPGTFLAIAIGSFLL